MSIRTKRDNTELGQPSEIPSYGQSSHPFRAASIFRQQQRIPDSLTILDNKNHQPDTMEIRFRECDFFNLWIWLELDNVPSPMEQQYIEEIFDSWFFLGKLGGFNAENLQVQDGGHEISYMDYDHDEADSSLMSVMHNMSEVQFQGTWARCWFDLGTTDAIALDVLVNTLKQFSKDYINVQRVYIGGENEDWPIPRDQQADFVDAMH